MFDSSKNQTVQNFAVSKDGTKVPHFLTHRKDIQLDGSNPTVDEKEGVLASVLNHLDVVFSPFALGALVASQILSSVGMLLIFTL